MKTLATKFFTAVVLISLLVAPGLRAFAGNTPGKATTVAPSKGTGSQSDVTTQQVSDYLASLGKNVVSVAPANDGSGNYIATNQDGSHTLVLMSGTNFNGLEIFHTEKYAQTFPVPGAKRII